MKRLFLTAICCVLATSCAEFSHSVPEKDTISSVSLEKTSPVKRFDFVLFQKYNAKNKKQQSRKKITFKKKKYVEYKTVFSKKSVRTVFAGEYGDQAVLGVRVQAKEYKAFLKQIRRHKQGVLNIYLNDEVLFVDRIDRIKHKNGVIFLPMSDLENAYRVAKMIRGKL